MEGMEVAVVRGEAAADEEEGAVGILVKNTRHYVFTDVSIYLFILIFMLCCLFVFLLFFLVCVCVCLGGGGVPSGPKFFVRFLASHFFRTATPLLRNSRFIVWGVPRHNSAIRCTTGNP